ncbi:MAG: hypothetical protein ABH885_03925 [Candidatus Omnitrophota bacterium]
MAKEGIKDVLIVCTGNSCRSIMAEGYLKKRAKELGLDLNAHSAGTGAMEHMPPSPETVEVMKEEGIDVSRYKSTCIAPDIIQRADVVLIMEPHHQYIIHAMAPDSDDKVFFLREFDAEADEKNIPDPIGKSKTFYTNVLFAIKDSIEGFLGWLKN